MFNVLFMGVKVEGGEMLKHHFLEVGHLAYLTALTSSMISSSLMAGLAGRLLMKRSSNCSRVSACQPNLRISSRNSD
jgi:hypothetical protein